MKRIITDDDRAKAKKEWDSWRNDRVRYEQELAAQAAEKARREAEEWERVNPLLAAKRKRADQEWAAFREERNRKKEESQARDSKQARHNAEEYERKKKKAAEEWEAFRRERESKNTGSKSSDNGNEEKRRSRKSSTHPFRKIANRQEALAMLDLKGTPDRREINRMYRRKVIEWHPDKFHSGSQAEIEFATERMKLLNAAREYLTAAF